MWAECKASNDDTYRRCRVVVLELSGDRDAHRDGLEPKRLCKACQQSRCILVKCGLI